MFGGPPRKLAIMVARPSPSMVLLMPGSFRKSLPVTELMAMMSPKCSMAGASVIGMMKRMGSHWKTGKTKSGTANHGAAATFAKS